MMTRTLRQSAAALAFACLAAGGLVGCQKEAAKPTATTKPAPGMSTPTPMVSGTDTMATSRPLTLPTDVPVPTTPDAGGTRGMGYGTGTGGTTGGGLPPLPKITPGTLPSLPQMQPSTRPATTRPAFP
ncbi:MAG: hypothetical protein JWO31_581, partial [Phycisphaerales bacterium]|nr:hypothetical protein [Phycisphaerales bacterium]